MDREQIPLPMVKRITVSTKTENPMVRVNTSGLLDRFIPASSNKASNMAKANGKAHKLSQIAILTRVSIRMT